MNKIEKNKLGYLGEEFQYKLVKAFMEEDSFLASINMAVDQNMFTAPNLNMFVGIIKDYIDKYDLLPSYEIMEIHMREKAHNDTDIEVYKAIIDKIKHTSCEGIDDIKEVAMKFFRQQKMIRVANNILKLAGDGNIDNYDECLSQMESAMSVGKSDDEGVSPFDLMDEALSPTFTVQIPTGIDKLDDVMRGGLDKGKMGIIIGSAGFGKSTMTTAFASYASTYKCEANNYEGFKVMQIFFEDNEVDITKKHFSRITQVEARDLTENQTRIDEVRSVLENWPDKEMMKKNLRLKRFDTGDKTANDIYRYLKKTINGGFKPDLVIIDYFECLEPERSRYTSNDSEWTAEGKTMRKLENLAKKLNVALWVPVQGNKESINSQLVTMDKAGGSIKKVQVAQVVISIARTLEDADNNRATLALLKNRGGKASVAFENITFNNGTSTISCDDAMSLSNKIEVDDMIQKQKALETLNLGRQKMEELKREREMKENKSEWEESKNEFA